MAKQTIANNEVKTGRHPDKNRKAYKHDGFRYISKCPFGIYYVADTEGKKGKRNTVSEELHTLRNHRQFLMLASQSNPSLKKGITERIKSLLLAEVELQSYSPNDIICRTKAGRYELKDQFASTKQKVKGNFGNVAF